METVQEKQMRCTDVLMRSEVGRDCEFPTISVLHSVHRSGLLH